MPPWPTKKTQPVVPLAEVNRLRIQLTHDALEPSSRSSYNSAVRCYAKQCAARGIEAWPVTHYNLGNYIIWYCTHRGNSSYSIPTIKCHLKRFSLIHELPWLHGLDSFLNKDLERALAKKDTHTPRRKLPITFEILQKLLPVTRNGSLQDLQVMAMCTLAHDGLLRGGELCTLRLHDLRWLTPARDAFDLTIHKSKCNKTGPPEVIFLQSYPAPQYLSAAVVVRRYLSDVELVFGVNLATLPPSTPLFPADWRTPAIALSRPIFVDQLQAMLLEQASLTQNIRGTLSALEAPQTYTTRAVGHSLSKGLAAGSQTHGKFISATALSLNGRRQQSPSPALLLNFPQQGIVSLCPSQVRGVLCVHPTANSPKPP